MERITKELPNGTWEIEGVSWKEVPGNLYGALCKLRDYENTGLSPAEINTLIDKLDKLTILNTGIPPKTERGFVHCPKCNKLFSTVEYAKEDFFCGDCGQHIFFNKERWLEQNVDKSE